MAKFKLWVGVQAGLLVLLLAVAGNVAEAHVLKQDNGTTAVLHIPPEDNPQAGQKTVLQVSFYNDQNTFSLQDCSCGVAVMQSARVIQKADLSPAATGATLNAETTVTFPKAGVYNLVITGKSLDGKFGSFSLTYLERVTGGTGNASDNNNGSEAVIVGVASLVVLGMIASNAIANGGRYVPKKSGKK